MTEDKLPEIAAKLRKGEFRNIVFMVGAGISTSAGIPDFRSPETGLYSNLEKLNLPYPEAVFDIEYFRKSPRAFYTLAHDLYPGKYRPTKFHKFIKLIENKGYLRRVYTQNIDTLERLAGVSGEKIIEAHGSFAKHRCIDCRQEMSTDNVKQAMWGSNADRHKVDSKDVRIPRCKSKKCPTKGGGLVKPDIVFYGEGLPESFFDGIEEDFPDKVDLAIIAGTSLTVHPFAQLPEMLDSGNYRILFNNERVGTLGRRKHDVVVLGDIDGQVERLVELCGWTLPGSESESVGRESSLDAKTQLEHDIGRITEDLEQLGLVKKDGKKKDIEKHTDDLGDQSDLSGESRGPGAKEPRTEETKAAESQDERE